jgi:RNA polymerase sigma-32 factor
MATKRFKRTGRSPSRAVSADALSIYFNEIARYPLLSRGEELRLARVYRDSNDPKAAHVLTTSNLRFVVKICNEYRSLGLAMMDLIQEGNLGLMKAVEKFNPDKGIRLISYAVWWIRSYIRDHILRSWSLVRLGTTQAQRKLFFSLSRTKRELELFDGQPGIPPSTERIAEVMHVRPEEVDDMERRTIGRDVSLDAPMYEDGESRIDFLASPEPTPEEILSVKREGGLTRKLVEAALAVLEPRELVIVKARVMSEDPATLEVLGRRLGFSAERARQLEIRAKEKLTVALTELVQRAA